jgi:DNA polymerase III subunit beta
MKVTIPIKALTAALKVVVPAAGRRSTLPILGGLMIQAPGSQIAFEATDLEASARIIVKDGVNVLEDGCVVLPSKALGKAVSTMKGDEVELLADEGSHRAAVRCGARVVTLDGFDPADWPRTDTTELVSVASVEAAVLAQALNRVGLCASDDEARPALTSIALFLNGGSIQAVATDSYRMGVMEIPVEEAKPSDALPLLVPARVAKALAKQLKGCRSRVQIRIRESSTSRAIVFSFENAVWTTRLVEGEFPNWQQLMPGFEGASCDFGSAELASVLKTMAAVRSNGTPVRLSLGGQCSIRLSEQHIGDVTEELTDAHFTADGVGPIEVAFNLDYLADALRFCGGDRVRIFVRDGLKPALLGTPEARYLLMPIRMS